MIILRLLSFILRDEKSYWFNIAFYYLLKFWNFNRMLIFESSMFTSLILTFVWENGGRKCLYYIQEPIFPPFSPPSVPYFLSVFFEIITDTNRMNIEFDAKLKLACCRGWSLHSNLWLDSDVNALLRVIGFCLGKRILHNLTIEWITWKNKRTTIFDCW